MKWTQDQINLVSRYLEMGSSYQEIATKLNLSYDQVEQTVKRYNLRDKVAQPDAVLHKEKGKLTKDDITVLAKRIGEGIYDNYKNIDLPTFTPIKRQGKREEMSVLDISDVHVGMVNEVFDSISGKKMTTYNMNIFKKELITLQDSVNKIHAILSHSYDLKELTIFFLGDIVTNDRIFESQVFEIEEIVGKQVFDAVTYFSIFINNMLGLYQRITVVGMVGNHGRSNPYFRDEPVENNFEFFLYKILQKQFENNNRVNVIVPETRRYIHHIYGWKHLLEHGDSIRGGSEAAIMKQAKELYINMGGFDVYHVGHYHQIKEIEMADQCLIKMNGSWINKDNYAFRLFKTYSRPAQFFFGCSKTRPETWGYRLDLRTKV